MCLIRIFVKFIVLLVVTLSINGVTAAICNSSAIFLKRNNFKPNNAPTTLLFNSSTPGTGITLQCFNSCNSLDDCSSFYIDYDTSSCYGLNSSLDQNLVLKSTQQVTSHVNYFQRVCIQAVPLACLVNLWSLDVVPGYRLVGYDKSIIENVTLYACASSCFNETSFTCRSAAFRSMTSSGVGQCILSSDDRRTQADSYRAVPDNIVYIENQCTRPQSGSCSLSQFQDSTLVSYTDISITNTSIEQCEQRCQAERRFVCRGFTYQPGNDSTTASSCSIHSDDSFDLGPAAVIEQVGSVYRERVACLDLTVRCNSSLINVTLVTSEPFSGRMYARDVSDPSCGVDGTSTTSTSLLLSIVTMPGSPSCGSVTTTLDNSTGVTAVSRVASAVIVVQQNSIIQTVSDRTVRVACYISNQNPVDTMLNKSLIVDVGNGNNGVSNVTANASASGLPTLRLHIIDLDNGTSDTNQTTLGRNLQFRVDLQPANSNFDILVYDLTATDATQANSQLLLDSTGCPTNTNIFPGLYRDPTGNYAANFSAFRITNSALVRFNLTVHFCELACQEIVCTNPGVGRLRREDDKDIISSLNQSRSTSDMIHLSRYTDDNMDQSRIVMPKDESFQFDLIVGEKARRSVIENISANVIVADVDPENKTKIAGAESNLEYVCLQYSTFLALIFSWAAVQVVLFIIAFMMVRWQLTRQDDELKRKLEDELNLFDSNRRMHWSENIEAVAMT